MIEITEADLELLATPDEQIAKRHQVFCFDEAEFFRRMPLGERWQQLIQSHLYLEHIIDRLLREAIRYPEEVSFSRMPFRQRVDLASALGLLPRDLVNAIRKLSKMRNNVAHAVCFEVSDADELDLKNCTPKWLKERMTKEPRLDREIPLWELLRVIVLQTEIIRQQHAAHREIERKSMVRLRTVLDKTPGANYVP